MSTTPKLTSCSKNQATFLHRAQVGASRVQRDILSGAGHPRFQSILKTLVTGPQMERIGAAVASLA